ncbi:family 78 glycoside hydrolase catalytic domain [Opitutus sp. ER46]|uniref:family 78 glycoside hydrolase catalytic domain n=1 Tax=Opitutus sp. ER46 TaxID=2161864 RepID=UPI000D2FAFC8|nr:family 78 glycoside hydrolase catalytic domain [Opitutus sp. ER46]PTX94384.1 alpha-L-rhamnosidase [Opitutus sp. ER46]
MRFDRPAMNMNFVWNLSHGGRAPAALLTGLLLALLAPTLARGVSAPVTLALRVTEPKCELGTNPAGIDVAAPRLSWRVASDVRGQCQTAYQVLAASTSAALAADRGVIWDSGKIASDDTTSIRYAGAPLASSQTVWWKVRVWDRDGRPTAWTGPQRWTMGLLQPTDWKGVWIAAPATTETLMLRREFAVRPGLRRAIVHVSGLGQYELFLNGRRVGEDLLSPGWTNYDEVTLYDTHDVTALLREGGNAAGMVLGNGMYHVQRRSRFAKFTGSFGPLRAVLHLQLEYADGSVDFVGTDERWRTRAGAITFSSMYGGEDFDARLYPTGWDRVGFDERSWLPAVRVNRPADTLRGYTFAAEPTRAIETRPAANVRQLKPGVVLYDFGQNALFMPRVRVSGPAGSIIRMTPGEALNEDGTIDRGTMGGGHRGSAWWQYTKATDAEESWFPQFYFVGSRYLYVELFPAGAVPPGATVAALPAGLIAAPTGETPASGTGTSGALPKIEALEQVVVHSTAEPVGTFATSNPLLNRIRDLVRWAQRSNLVSIIMDCPHREKLGWLEQTHLNGPALRYEWDLTRLYAKVSADMARAQLDTGLVPNIAPEYTVFKGAFRNAAEWGAAFIMVPWQQYQFTGDSDLLRARYDAMRRYFAFLESRAPDGLLRDGLGDWYDYQLGKEGRAYLTPPPLTATAFYYQDAIVMAKIATVLGRADDAASYTTKAATIRERFNREFLRPDTPEVYGSGSQTSLALPLALGLVPPEHRARVLDALVRDLQQRGYTSAGAAGIRYVFQALAENGRSDVVYGFVNQDEKPGYGYQLKLGLTTLAESWNASRGASWNHFFLGQVIEWYYADLAGIQPDPSAPGFKRVIVRPQPVGDLTSVEATYKSIHGPIGVRWTRADGRFALKVSVPANTTATIHVPAKPDTAVTESGQPAAAARGVTFLRWEGDRAVFAVESGTYEFASTW